MRSLKFAMAGTPARFGVTGWNPQECWLGHTNHTNHTYIYISRNSSSSSSLRCARHARAAGVGRNVWFGVAGVTKPVSMGLPGCHSYELSAVAGVAKVRNFVNSNSTNHRKKENI